MGRERLGSWRAPPPPIRTSSTPGEPTIHQSADDLDDASITELATRAGIRRVHILAWRDLDDIEAGGSEVHAAQVAARWAAAGLDVTMRTSGAQGQRHNSRRDGYRVIRRGGRYRIFPGAALSERAGWHGPSDALVEVWNGVPFFSPAWFNGPNITVIHHVHQDMWEQVLDPRRARIGRFVEARVAPRFYRETPIVTVSPSSRRAIVELLGLPEHNITVASPGVDAAFAPGDQKSPHPLVLGVGRLTPTKRFDELILTMREVRSEIPDVELVLAGDGYERPNLDQLIDDIGARDWVRLAGYVSDAELRSLYRQAWVLASTSTAEGWGMTITEAAACGTPAVATHISGHVDSIVDGKTGLLAADRRTMVADLTSVLRDTARREELSRQAHERASELTWDRTAHDTFVPLARTAIQRRGR